MRINLADRITDPKTAIELLDIGYQDGLCLAINTLRETWIQIQEKRRKRAGWKNWRIKRTKNRTNMPRGA
jgi:hypothetical protein